MLGQRFIYDIYALVFHNTHHLKLSYLSLTDFNQVYLNSF